MIDSDRSPHIPGACRYYLHYEGFEGFALNRGRDAGPWRVWRLGKVIATAPTFEAALERGRMLTRAETGHA